MARRQLTEAQRAEAAEQRRVLVEQLHAQLRDGVDAIRSGDQWRDYLTFASRFHRYSANNTLLLMMQNPQATHVASYRTWQAAGRQVRKGETALRVMGPVTKKTEKVDTNGRPVLDAAGRPVTVQQIVGVKPVPVFDISQTEGDPVPAPPRPQLLGGEAPAGLWDALAEQVQGHGFQLVRGQLPAGTNGQTDYLTMTVTVEDRLDDAQAVKTLAHELGHVMLHRPDDAGQREVDCRGLREVEAESVAFIVAQGAGMTTDGYSFPYVAGWAQVSGEEDPVRATAARVLTTSHTVLEALETHQGDRDQDPVDQGLAARAAALTEQTAQLRDDAEAIAAAAAGVTLRDVLDLTHSYYQQQVPDSWVPEYLASRGLASQQQSAQIGHAPAGWSHLVDHLREHGVTDQAMVAAGVARTRNGRTYDLMRDRVTIPLRDVDGRLVGFTARINPDSENTRQPKYVNTPTTVQFAKAEVLYGLGEHRSQLAAGAQPVIVEGAFDALAVTAASDGRQIGLAPCGTALSNTQTRQLLDTIAAGTLVSIGYDSDPAGVRATHTAWDRLADHGHLAVTRAALAAGTDPADYVAAGRGPALEEAVKSGQPLVDWTTQQLLEEASPAQRDNYLWRWEAMRHQVQHQLERVPTDGQADYLARLSRTLEVDLGETAGYGAQHLAVTRPVAEIPTARVDGYDIPQVEPYTFGGPYIPADQQQQFRMRLQ